MNSYKTFFFSIMVSSFFMGTPSFSVKPESYAFDSFRDISVEGQPSTHKTLPQIKKDGLVLIGASRGLIRPKDEEQKHLHNTLVQLKENGVKINLITSRGSKIPETAKKTETEQDLEKIGLDFKAWNTLVLPEDLILEGPEGSTDDAYIVKNGIIYSYRDNPNHKQPHKSAAIHALLKKIEVENLPVAALYLIDGASREIIWTLEDIKDSPIPIHLFHYLQEKK